MAPTWNPKEAARAQAEYCERTEQPMFAPGKGICFRCGRNIYLPARRKSGIIGYSVEKAGSELIIGCPYCSTSFIE